MKNPPFFPLALEIEASRDEALWVVIPVNPLPLLVTVDGGKIEIEITSRWVLFNLEESSFTFSAGGAYSVTWLWSFAIRSRSTWQSFLASPFFFLHALTSFFWWLLFIRYIYVQRVGEKAGRKKKIRWPFFVHCRKGKWKKGTSSMSVWVVKRTFCPLKGWTYDEMLRWTCFSVTKKRTRSGVREIRSTLEQLSVKNTWRSCFWHALNQFQGGSKTYHCCKDSMNMSLSLRTLWVPNMGRKMTCFSPLPWWDYNLQVH